MYLNPQESDAGRLVRQDISEDFRGQPYQDYFHRTGPLVDVYETSDDLVVSCEVPGLERKEDMEIHVMANSLTLNGIVQRASADVSEHRVHRTERFYGNFFRVVPLPTRVKEDTARASYRNGILEVRIEKDISASGKRIDINFQ